MDFLEMAAELYRRDCEPKAGIGGTLPAGNPAYSLQDYYCFLLIVKNHPDLVTRLAELTEMAHGEPHNGPTIPVAEARAEGMARLPAEVGGEMWSIKQEPLAEEPFQSPLLPRRNTCEYCHNDCANCTCDDGCAEDTDGEESE